MACTQIWALVAVMYFCAHSYTIEEQLDKVFVDSLEPLWYMGQPFPACEAIIDKFYSCYPDRLEYVSNNDMTYIYMRGFVI